MGSFGKGSLQKVSRKFRANVRKLSADIPHSFLTQQETYFVQFSADFPQKLRKKKPFANDPISELLKKGYEGHPPVLKIKVVTCQEWSLAALA